MGGGGNEVETPKNMKDFPLFCFLRFSGFLGPIHWFCSECKCDFSLRSEVAVLIRSFIDIISYAFS